MCVAFCLTTERFLLFPFVLFVLGSAQLYISIKLYSRDYRCVTDEEYDELESVPMYTEHYNLILDSGVAVRIDDPPTPWDEVYLLTYDLQEEAV